MANTGTHLVKSAQRVLQLLEYFGKEKPAATVTEIARALAYPQSSTSVLLRCLRQLGYLHYNRYHRTYRLTARAALLGCWAEEGAFRGGPVLELLDAVADRVDQTVVLSAAGCDHALHHVHVIRGSAPRALPLRVGDVDGILHSAQGELILSSYPDQQIKLALHRLNAEQEDPGRRVAIKDKVGELHALRARGWSMAVPAEPDARGAVAALIPRRKGGDRLAVSIVADGATLAEKVEEFLDIMLTERDKVYDSRSSKPNGFSSPLMKTLPNKVLIGRNANEASPAQSCAVAEVKWR